MACRSSGAMLPWFDSVMDSNKHCSSRRDIKSLFVNQAVIIQTGLLTLSERALINYQTSSFPAIFNMAASVLTAIGLVADALTTVGFFEANVPGSAPEGATVRIKGTALQED